MGKTSIIYSSSHGNTEKILKEILSLAGSSAEMVKVSRASASDILEADKVVLGGSIHAGKIQKELADFTAKHKTLLLQKRLAVFIGCLDKEESSKQLEKAFPEDIKNHAEVKACIGGNLELKRLPLVLRMIMKLLVKKEKDRTFYSSPGREKLVNFLVN